MQCCFTKLTGQIYLSASLEPYLHKSPCAGTHSPSPNAWGLPMKLTYFAKEINGTLVENMSMSTVLCAGPAPTLLNGLSIDQCWKSHQ